MSAIRSKGNRSTELAVIKIFRQKRITGWRRHLKTVSGKPDFAFQKLKVAIFIDGCFWHGCKLHGVLPKTNKLFWANKLSRNKNRDKTVSKTLKESGWKVIRIWEHDLKKQNIIEAVMNKHKLYGKTTL